MRHSERIGWSENRSWDRVRTQAPCGDMRDAIDGVPERRRKNAYVRAATCGSHPASTLIGLSNPTWPSNGLTVEVKSAKLPRSPVRVHDGLRAIQPNLVVHSVTEFLFAAQVAFRRLYRDVAQEKLDLFQFATCKMAQTCAAATQIVGSHKRGGFFNQFEKHQSTNFHGYIGQLRRASCFLQSFVRGNVERYNFVGPAY